MTNLRSRLKIFGRWILDWYSPPHTRYHQHFTNDQHKYNRAYLFSYFKVSHTLNLSTYSICHMGTNSRPRSNLRSLPFPSNRSCHIRSGPFISAIKGKSIHQSIGQKHPSSNPRQYTVSNLHPTMYNIPPPLGIA